MRPNQWTKNFLLFAGIIFSQNISNIPMLLHAISGFILFCLISSAVYIINDINDVEKDKAHPIKRFRPIPAGLISIKFAIILATFLAIISIALSFFINKSFGMYALVYFIMMVCYSIILKQVVILDILIIAIGFVIRASAGIEAIRYLGQDVPISPWFIACTLFLALFIAICKRRHELFLLNNNAIEHRKVLEEYSPEFINQMVSVSTSATVISYALYTITGTKFGSEKMVMTIPFVLYGVFRYLYLVYKKDEGGAPDVLIFKDKYLVINVLLWLITVCIILYPQIVMCK